MSDGRLPVLASRRFAVLRFISWLLSSSDRSVEAALASADADQFARDDAAGHLVDEEAEHDLSTVGRKVYGKRGVRRHGRLALP